MPHVDITMISGRDHEAKKVIAQKVQKFLGQELQIEEKFVSVSIEDVPKEKWAEHMKSMQDKEMFVLPL